MPITITGPRALTVKDQKELFLIEIFITCDGTNNTVLSIQRSHQAVTRDNANTEIRRDDTRIQAQYLLSDFAGAVQTGIANFVNALDVKP